MKRRKKRRIKRKATMLMKDQMLEIITRRVYHRLSRSRVSRYSQQRYLRAIVHAQMGL